MTDEDVRKALGRWLCHHVKGLENYEVAEVAAALGVRPDEAVGTIWQIVDESYMRLVGRSE